MLQPTIVLFVLSLFGLSNSLLVVAGINYMGQGGSPFQKIHPSLYILALLLCMTLLADRRAKAGIPSWVGGLYTVPMLAGATATVVMLALGRSGGGDLSAVVTTFLAPAVFVYVAQYASEPTWLRLRTVILSFFAVNSLIGIAELMTGWRLLPFYAADQLITFDPRPTALLGHPLTNSVLTGALLLLLVMGQIVDGLRLSTMLQAGLHGAAMAAFGARAALVFCGLFLAVFILRHIGLLGRIDGQRVRRAVSVVLLGGLLAAALFAAGITDALVDRFETADKSTRTRYAAVKLIERLKPVEWLLGTEPSARQAYLTLLDTPFGIEISPIAMVFAYGLPLTLLLLAATYRLLFQLARNAFPGARYIVAYVIATTAMSLSIGSKSLLITQVAVILLAMRRQVAADVTPRSPRRIGPVSRPILLS